MIYRQIIAVIVLIVVSHLSGQAQYRDSIVMRELTKRDCATVYFRFYKFAIDSGYKRNAYDLSQMDSILTNVLHNPKYRVDSIVMMISNAPDGNLGYNYKLGKIRMESLKRYVFGKYPELIDVKVITHINDANWSGLRKLISDDPNVPSRREALEIIDSKSTSRDRLLTELDGGKTFRYVTQNMLRYLRSGTVCVNSRYSVTDTVRIQEEVATVKSQPEDESICAPTQIEPVIQTMTPRHPKLALKNNLLYDALLLLNIELEFYFGRRWSLNLDYQFAWWSFSSSDRFYQIMAGSPEVRYWLRPDAQFNGHFVGAYAGTGYYDLKYSEIGYQGEFYIALGASYGYYLPVKRGFGVEFSLGVGYMVTEYRKYIKELSKEDYYVKAGVDRSKYFGPTKAKISLVWRLGDKNKSVQ